MDQQRVFNEREELRELLTEVLKVQELILRRLDRLEERLERRTDTDGRALVSDE
jgi:hypothetical protein